MDCAPLPDLAGQPLLLLMLALYDAQANEVQTARGQGRSLGRGRLYERLLASYAEREVRKSHGGAPETTIAALVEAEMLRLSVVAFAMFNRSQLWVTRAPSSTRISPRCRSAPASPGVAEPGLRTPLTAGQELVGRFFFIQRAQALRDDRTLQTYEFLHATFGEYLVARLLVRVLTDLAAREAAATLPLRSSSLDDGLLYSLMSFAPLTARQAVLPFVSSFLGESGDTARLNDLVIRTFHNATHWTDTPASTYHPVPLPLVDRHAIYTLNLLLLAVAGGQVTTTQLFPEAEEPIDEWRKWSQRWQAAIDGDSWYTLIYQIDARRTWNDLKRELQLVRDETEPQSVDPYWIHNFPPGSDWRRLSGFRYEDHRMVQLTYYLRGELFDEVFRHALEPILDVLGPSVTHFAPLDEQRAESVAHSLIALWLASDLLYDLGFDPESHLESERNLTGAYERAVQVVTRAWQRNAYPDDAGRSLTLLLTMLRRDEARLPAGDVRRWYGIIRDSHYYDVDLHEWLMPEARDQP